MNGHHPASGHLFTQGSLDAELSGRIKRLRQEVRDYDLAQLVDELATCEKLVAKFRLEPVRFATDTSFVDHPTYGPAVQVQFYGSSVLLHRRPAADVSANLHGRVIETFTFSAGGRERDSWVLLPQPPSEGDAADEREQWRDRTVGRLAELIALANARVDSFDGRLAEAAAAAVAARRARLSSPISVSD